MANHPCDIVGITEFSYFYLHTDTLQTWTNQENIRTLAPDSIALE